ncbi:YdcF family protein [Atlantibacter sp.]|uniref:YdcF family protein n=1 Tax=Atlantibacter sp. TaxID=1903473 RepID=UPI0028A8B709|nr:YdcF family protein [Atlantibacter sp.]
MTPFPPLSPALINAANTLGQWLAQDDSAVLPAAKDIGLVVLAGNAAIPAIDAACREAAQRKVPLLISGGIGHSTPFLYAAVARHPRYNVLPTTGRSEAAVLADIATRFWHIPADKLLVEDKSTNCGENAAFTRDMMTARDVLPPQAIVVQDPTMQRRTAATFARVWRDAEHQVEWFNVPGMVPTLITTPRDTRFAEGEGWWSVDRYLSLIVGEIPRLRNDKDGYGPNGRGFIEAVDIPEAVLAAWQTLRHDPSFTAILNR